MPNLQNSSQYRSVNGFPFTLSGAALLALPSGALWWPEHELLCVSDLHLGKAERISRKGGANLPPYEIQDTLSRLERDLEQTSARTVICLGDSFDDLSAERAFPEDAQLWIARLQAGRRWIWIEGNHDPGPIHLGGQHMAEFACAPLLFRHIANPASSGEVSGHYHPKAQVSLRGRARSFACFLLDQTRLILPAYGTYTGGLRCDHPTLDRLINKPGLAILTGKSAQPIPMPRAKVT